MFFTIHQWKIWKQPQYSSIRDNLEYGNSHLRKCLAISIKITNAELWTSSCALGSLSCQTFACGRSDVLVSHCRASVTLDLYYIIMQSYIYWCGKIIIANINSTCYVSGTMISVFIYFCLTWILTTALWGSYYNSPYILHRRK